MATSKKIEEKYQKLLKEIQKRPENKMCFDCNSRGNPDSWPFYGCHPSRGYRHPVWPGGGALADARAEPLPGLLRSCT